MAINKILLLSDHHWQTVNTSGSFNPLQVIGTKNVSNAHFILNMTTGKIIKNRYQHNIGERLSFGELEEYRNKYEYYKKEITLDKQEHFDDKLFEV